MSAQYTKQQLQKALEKAQLDPQKNAGIIEEINTMIETGKYIQNQSAGSLVYDQLNQDEDYNEALRSFYKANPETGEAMTAFAQSVEYDNDGNAIGDSAFLKEKSFELFNSVMMNEINLINFGRKLNKMSQSERDNIAKLYDVYERTKMTGEGSRPLKEQLKDGLHMLYAPSTFVGGGWITRPMQKTAYRQAMKKMLSGGLAKLSDPEKQVIKQATVSYAKRSGVVGAGYTGAFDAGIQKNVEMGLDPDQEFDAGRTAKMTAAGFGMGWALSKAPKVAGQVLRAPGALVNKGVANAYNFGTSPVQTTGDAVMKAFGGKKAARAQVVKEGTEAFGLKADQTDVSGHGLNMQGQVKNASQQGFNNFKQRFDSLGDLAVNDVSILNTIDAIEQQLPTYKGLSNIKRKITEGTITPTQALRKIRSKLGLALKNSKNPNNALHDFKDDIVDINTQVRDYMSNAAKRSGKFDEFKAIDDDYAEFINVNNHKEVQKLMADESSKTVDTLRNLGKSSQDNINKLEEHITRLEKLAKFSSETVDGQVVPNQSLIDSNMQAMRAIVGEQMFKGESGAGLNAYLGTDQGRKVLGKIFEGKEDTIKRLSDIRQNSQDKGDMGIFAMRILTGVGTVAFGATGQVSSALATGGAFVGMEALLRSPWFRRAAANTFARSPTKSLAEKIKLSKILEKRGYSVRDTNTIMKTLVGAAAWSAILADEERRVAVRRSPQAAANAFANSWIGKLALDNVYTKGAIGGISEAIGSTGEAIDEKVFKPTFDTVTDLLISDN